MSRTFIAVASGLIWLTICTASTAAGIDVEFTNFAIGTTFPAATLPTRFTSDEVDIVLSPGRFGGNGRIIDTELFGSPNPGLFLAAGLQAQIVLPAPSTGGFFFFRNQGRSNLLQINGHLINFTDSALAGDTFTTLAGVEIHSSPLSGFYRSVKLDGTINTLVFIGQELSIDSIALAIVPEPSTFALLILCASFAVISRR